MLQEEEDQAIYDLKEGANGTKSELLIFVHPNITDVMFSLISCIPGTTYADVC
jgi:hypothetical protein